MESKSPKRTREATSELISTKRSKGEAGDPVPGPPVVLSTLRPTGPFPSTQPSSSPENTFSVEKAFVRTAEARERLREGRDSAGEGFTLEGLRKALEEVESRSGVERDVSEQFSSEKRRQSEMRSTAATLETRINILETALKDVHTTSQARIIEQKLRLEGLEAERSTSLKAARREIDQLQSHLDIYKRICGVELTALETGYRAKVKYQHNEIIVQLTPVSKTELEVELKSYTVPAERIEADLKEAIVIDPRDAPVLLHHLYQCLV